MAWCKFLYPPTAFSLLTCPDHVAEPNAYLAITGAGIETVNIKKKALVYPFQKVTKFSITPFDFSMQLQAMTVEKLKASLTLDFYLL